MLTNLWPRPDAPYYGTFVESQTRSVAADPGVDVTVHVIDGRRSPLPYLRGALAMLRLNFEPRRFDLVHAHTGHSGVLARLQLRYPVLVSYVGYDLYGKPKPDGSPTAKSRVEGVAFRLLSRIVDATVTKSAHLESLLPRAAREHNTVLPNGVDTARFRPLGREQARAELGWSMEEPTVVWVGNADVPRKRLWLAEAAMDRVRQAIPEARLRVCSKVDPHEVPLWMSAADVMLFTSMAEGSPNVIKEAMACDLPIVTVATGDTVEVVEGTRRCAVSEADPDALAAATIELLRERPARSNGREVTGHLALERIADRLIAIYRELAARRP